MRRKKIALAFNTAVSLLVVVALLVSGASAWWGQNGRYIRETIASTSYALRVLKFAWEMDRIYDSLPDQPIRVGERPVGAYLFVQWNTGLNDQQLGDAMELVLPYFYYEGVVDGDPVVPRVIGFVPFPGMASMHVLGRASCWDAVAIFNYGYANPYSTRYQHVSLLATLVHELGHVNGICWIDTSKGETSGEMEAANQVATIEILAAVSNHGNPYAVKPTVLELRQFALNYVEAAEVSATGRAEWTHWFERTFIYTEPEELARYEKARRYWAESESNRELLKYIIEAYGATPWWFIAEALANEEYGYATRQLGYYPNRAGHIKLNDVAYFLEHLSDAVQIGRQTPANVQ